MNKTIKQLSVEQLKEIAKVFSSQDWTLAINAVEYEWEGWDLASEDYIFQLSFEGSIGIWQKSDWSVYRVELNYTKEDLIRKELSKQLSKQLKKNEK
jgi:hypothetical protein